MNAFTGNEIIAGVQIQSLLTIPLKPVFYTGSHTAIYQDLGKLVLMNSGGANSLTIPSNKAISSRQYSQFVSWPIGAILVVVQYGAGTTSFAAGEGVTIHSEDDMVDMAARYVSAGAICVAPDEWLLLGRLA